MADQVQRFRRVSKIECEPPPEGRTLSEGRRCVLTFFDEVGQARRSEPFPITGIGASSPRRLISDVDLSTITFGPTGEVREVLGVLLVPDQAGQFPTCRVAGTGILCEHEEDRTRG